MLSMTPSAARLRLDSGYLSDFNWRAVGMTGPYGLAAAALSWAAITAGAAVPYPTIHDQTPAAHVRMVGPGTASMMMYVPLESIQRNYAGTATGPPPSG